MTAPSAPDDAALLDSPRAWAVAAAAFVANAIGFGTTYSFGAFFADMSAEFGTGRGSTAVVFSLTLLFFFGFGVVSGPLADRYGPRVMVVVGGVLFCAGLLATSVAPNIVVGYLTYGIGVGVGCGCWITPVLAAVGGWFRRRRALALGITATGSGLGTLVLSPVAARLIDAYGWRQAYVVLAVIGAVGLAGAAVAVRPAPGARPGGGAGAHLRRASSTSAFRLLWISGLLMSVGLYVAFAFVVPFAKDAGIAAQPAALLVSVIGASSIVGRLGLTSLSGRIGPVRLYQVCLAAQPVAYLVWLGSGGRYPLLVLFAALLGITYGGFVALGPEVMVHLFGATGLGALIGLNFLGAGIGGLIGPIGAGTLADLTGGRTIPIVAAVVVTGVAAALLSFVREGSGSTPAD